VYNGTKKVPATHEYMFEKPFYYEGISYDEYFVEWVCFSESIVKNNIYKSVKQQLIDGDIRTIPEKYLKLCPNPENCTAYLDLLESIRKTA